MLTKGLLTVKNRQKALKQETHSSAGKKRILMKNLILMIMIGAMLMFSSEAMANYLIELKSGKRIVTRYYWEEDGQIMFYQLGGVVGFPADQVERITPADRPESWQAQGLEPETDPGQQVEDVFNSEVPEVPDLDAQDIRE